MIYDVAIIGGGPAGYTAAERLGQGGLKTILFEKDGLGGICLNEGCIPTKTLLYSAKLYDGFKSASKYGVSAGEGVSFDLGKIIARKKKIVRKLTAGIKQKLNNHEVQIEEGVARLVAENSDGTFTISCNDVDFIAKKLILCTGSSTFIPPIEGLNSCEYWTSKEALENKDLPESLAIIGGGVIGLEFASFFNSLGVKIEVIEMSSEILGAMDKELSAMLREEYAKRGIVFHLDTKVVKIDGHALHVTKGEEQFVIEADKILLSVGRVPNLLGLNLEILNLEKKGKALFVNEHMQTSHPNIYACGDITGFSLLAHTAIRESEVAANHLLGEKDEMSYKAIPSVVYTNPEIAGVGETDKNLKSEGIAFRVKSLPMAFSGRFVAENEMGNGVCKLFLDEKDRIIGCHMLGNPASELITIASIAIEQSFTLAEFRKIVFPHPSVGEIFHEILY